MSLRLNKKPKPFMDEDFLLETESAQALYHDYAKAMPIIDYHCHLPPNEIANDLNFNNLTHAWLYGDHYKWRAMRSNGVDESYCTGSRADEEKFYKWAETVPYTLRNPLYHWTHLELKRYFGIQKILSPDSAKEIYDTCTAALATPEYSVKNLLGKMNVEIVCTTDDPLDSLVFHEKIRKENTPLKVLPTFRPDRFILIENPEFATFVSKLGALTDGDIQSFEGLVSALEKRASFFASLGGKLADHGLEKIYAEDYSEKDVAQIFQKALHGKAIRPDEASAYKSAVLYRLGLLYHSLGWTQQFHLGAMRNNNLRALKTLGPDTGWDSIGDYPQATSLAKFLARLDADNRLVQTVLYNLNPSDNAVMSTMLGNFNDGSVAGKIQFGSGWWFLDQKEGMESQMNTLSNMGLLSRFVGMLTDSRSFLSFPRHEYFRRILCNLLGNDIENGELPNDLRWTGRIVQNISYHNAKSYFRFEA